MSKRIRSCKSCKVSCCKHGSGPYKLVSPEDYLENFGTHEAYNTKCMALDDNDLCRLWGTKEFPEECRTYVCQTRSFSKKELATISSIYERDCHACGTPWVIGYEDKDKNWTDYCEICGQRSVWKVTYKKGRVKLVL